MSKEQLIMDINFTDEEREATLALLDDVINSNERIMKAIWRKRSWRDSEKAMACGRYETGKLIARGLIEKLEHTMGEKILDLEVVRRPKHDGR